MTWSTLGQEPMASFEKSVGASGVVSPRRFHDPKWITAFAEKNSYSANIHYLNGPRAEIYRSFLSTKRLREERREKAQVLAA